MPQFLNSVTFGANVTLVSPNLSGTPTTSTPSNPIDSSPQVANTSWVSAYVTTRGYALDANVVHLAGAETISGTKAFSASSISFRGVPYAWPTAQGAANTVLRNDGTGNLTWIAAGGGGLANPSPAIWSPTFWNTSGTTQLSHIDGTYGNYCTDRADPSSLFVGYWAGKSVTTGVNNVYIGSYAAQNATTGQSNVVIGVNALGQAVAAMNSCTVVGYGAMSNINTGGPSCTAIGASALYQMTSGVGNTALGASAGSANGSGPNNTYLGNVAGSGGGSAPTRCTYLGYQTTDSGSGSTTNYTQSTALGANAQITASNQIVLGTSSESQLVIRGTPYTWPSGASAGMLQSDGSGNLSWLGDTLAPLAAPTIAINANYTMTAVNFGRAHVCSGTSTNYTVTLPPVAGASGKSIQLQMAPGLTKLVTIARNASDLIDGATTRVMWANEVATLFCDGTNWTKVSGKSIPMVCSMGVGASTTTIPNGSGIYPQLNLIISNPTGAMADASSTYRINLLRPATYILSSTTSWGIVANPPNYCQTAVYILKNNSSNPINLAQANLYTITGDYVQNISASSFCVAGDFIRMHAFQITSPSASQLVKSQNPNPITYIQVCELPAW